MSATLYEQSELALAAYASLTVGVTTDTINRDALVVAGFSRVQANEFAKRYPAIVATYSDPISDLQLTVFKDFTGNLTLAIRGTASGHDISVTDTRIAAAGMAFDQIVSLWN